MPNTIRVLYTGECPIFIPKRDTDVTVAERLAMAAIEGDQHDRFLIPTSLRDTFFELFFTLEEAEGNQPRMLLDSPQRWLRGPGDEIGVQRCVNFRSRMPPMVFVNGYATTISEPLGRVLMQRSGLFSPAGEDVPDIDEEKYLELESQRQAAPAAPADDIPQYRMDQAGNLIAASGEMVQPAAQATQDDPAVVQPGFGMDVPPAALQVMPVLPAMPEPPLDQPEQPG